MEIYPSVKMKCGRFVIFVMETLKTIHICTMIIKRFVYKSGVRFRRVEYDYSGYLCGQYKCKYRRDDLGGGFYDPICDLCKHIRHQFAYIKNLYIPDVN